MLVLLLQCILEFFSREARCNAALHSTLLPLLLFAYIQDTAIFSCYFRLNTLVLIVLGRSCFLLQFSAS